MCFLIVFMCLSWNFLLIRSEEDFNVAITLALGKNCSLRPAYTFTEGQNVTFVTRWPRDSKTIEEGWLKHEDTKINFPAPFLNRDDFYTMALNKSMEGIWVFEFRYLEDVNVRNVLSSCSTNVTIESKSIDSKSYNQFLISIIAVSVTAVIIIVAQAAFIVYLKTKATKGDRHNNLTKKSESTKSDTNRYCSVPRQKAVMPAYDIDPESTIYEAPNVDLSDRVGPTMQTPEPPAISTIPRTPKSKTHINNAPQAVLTPVFTSPTRRHQAEHFAKSRQAGIETADNTYEPPPTNTIPPRSNIAERKPLPTPKREDLQRHHKVEPMKPTPAASQQRSPPIVTPTTNELEQAFRRRNNEMETANNTFEPTPTNTSSPRSNIAQRKALPTPKPVVLQRHHKVRPMKPTPAASRQQHSPPSVPPTTNELEQALRRRNNGGPIQPRCAPVQIISQAIPDNGTYNRYSNETQDSSDEEWTYEPLKPSNCYDDDANTYYEYE